MAMQFQSVKCPECGANLQFDGQSVPSFCSYCGARIIATDDRETVHRYIDEAELKRAETERAVRMKELELMEREQAGKERREADLQAQREKIEYAKRIKTIAAIVVGALILLIAALGILSAIGPYLLIAEVVLLVMIHRDKKRLKSLELSGKTS